MHLVSFFCKPQALIPSVASTAAVSCGSRRQGSCPDGSRRCPEGYRPDHRWQQFVNDAGKFLDQSAREAERLGWRAENCSACTRTHQWPDMTAWGFYGS